MNLIAHPSILGDSLKLLAWTYENSYLVCLSNLPERVPQLFVLIRKSKLILHRLAYFPEPYFFQIALFIPDQGCRGHSGVNPLELTRLRLSLNRGVGKKKIFYPFYR